MIWKTAIIRGLSSCGNSPGLLQSPDPSENPGDSLNVRKNVNTQGRGSNEQRVELNDFQSSCGSVPLALEPAHMDQSF